MLQANFRTRPLLSVDLPDSTPAPPASPRRSLLARILLVAMGLILAMGVLLYLALHFALRSQATGLLQERLREQGQALTSYLENEKLLFARVVDFVAGDSDLVHATQYHLFLRGENKALQADVQRVARTFELPWMAVRESADAPPLVAAAQPGVPLALLSQLRLGDAGAAQAVQALWLDGAVWLVARSRLRLPGLHAVDAWAARPLAGLFGGLGTGPARLRQAAAGGSAADARSSVSVPLLDGAGRPAVLELPVRDDVGAAIASIVPIAGALLLVTMLLLGLALSLFLRRELAPVHALTGAAAAVGRGDFEVRVPAHGEGEVASLVHGFNRMVADLKRLHAVERAARHQEQLAAIGRMAARVAHDINNPLTVIKSSVHLARRRAGWPEPAQADLALIEHSCERCIGIVDALLRFGRPLRLRQQRLDLDELAADTVARFRRQHPQAQVTQVHSAAPVELVGDAYQLEQLIENLLANALHAAGEGEISVRVDSQAGRARLTVRDRGPGFTAQALAQFGEPFFTTKAQGTGLGLASCLAIARAHGGALEAHNEAGGCVVLTLPLDAACAPGAPAGSAGPGTAHAGTPHAGVTR